MGDPRRVYIETHGCTANRADSDIMAALLERAGFQLVESPQAADAIILNTCNVKKPTEDRMAYRISRLASLGRPVIAAGCMALTQPERLRPHAKVLLGPKSVHRVVDAVEIALRGERAEFLERDPLDKASLPRTRGRVISAPLPVAEGCLGACTFCITRFARGRLKSFSPDAIVERARELLSGGAVELLITAQDTAAYGRDIGWTLPRLLERILEIPGEYRLRVGMANPNTLARVIDNLLVTMRDPRVYRFLHVPVQSGSDEVLRRMARGYGAELFEGLVSKFRAAFRDTTLATDVIVGFPGETEDDFEMTVRLLERTRPEVVNISRYGPRPGTPASRWRPPNPATVKRRSRLISELVKEIGYRANESYVGAELTVLALERGPKGYQGRTDFYRPVALVRSDVELGSFYDVVIEEARPTYMVGRVLAKREVRPLEVTSTVTRSGSSRKLATGRAGIPRRRAAP